MDRPTIVVTLSDPGRAADPTAARAKNAKYLAALERAGAHGVALTALTPPDEWRVAFQAMNGLLISGGADLDPARYGAARHPRTKVDEGRDALDAAAWTAAAERRVPVLGICRGMQAINVFAGGTLVQHVEGHVAEDGPVVRHAIAIEPGSRLGRLAGPSLEVNSYHHQAAMRDGLGSGLRATATATAAARVAGDGHELVEAIEGTDASRWLVGVQCHPERTETSPPVLDALWHDFVAACRRR